MEKCNKKCSWNHSDDGCVWDTDVKPCEGKSVVEPKEELNVEVKEEIKGEIIPKKKKQL